MPCPAPLAIEIQRNFSACARPAFEVDDGAASSTRGTRIPHGQGFTRRMTVNLPLLAMNSLCPWSHGGRGGRSCSAARWRSSADRSSPAPALPRNGKKPTMVFSVADPQTHRTPSFGPDLPTGDGADREHSPELPHSLPISDRVPVRETGSLARPTH